MAKDITLYSPDGSELYYPKTVSNLVYNNDSGKTLKEELDNLGNATGIISLVKGGINLSTGVEEGTNRLRSGYLNPPLKVTVNEGYTIVGCGCYTKELEYVRGKLISNVTSLDIEKTDYLYRFTVKRNDDAEIQPTENVLKSISFGLTEYTEYLGEKIEENTTNITNFNHSISDINNKLCGIENSFEISEISGVLPTVSKYSLISKLESGEYGLPYDSYRYIENTFGVATLSKDRNYNYYLFAAIVYGEDIADKILAGSFSATKFSLMYNYGQNTIYKNILYYNAIPLDNNRFLLYVVSGNINDENNNIVSPTTAYLRFPKDNTFTLGVEKILLLDLNEWNTNYENILVKNADSNWYSINTFKDYEIKIEETPTELKRALFEGIAFWGSSSTEGSWVKNVAANLNMPYYWGGSGGENIWAIIGRMGVLPLRIKNSFTIPASSNETVALPDNYKMYVNWKGNYKTATIWGSKSVKQEKLLINPCYIAGVKGNIIGGGANSEVPLQFQRLEDGEAVTTKPYEPIYTFGFRETRDCVWFLACHFNGGHSTTDELVELYKKMYDVSASKKVIILGRHRVANGVITSPTLSELQEQETALDNEFGLMFFNTREYMCGRGFDIFKKKYPDLVTATDEEQAAQGITPDCMYVANNNVHFNNNAYGILTTGVTERLIALGYNLFRYGGDKTHPTYT